MDQDPGSLCTPNTEFVVRPVGPALPTELSKGLVELKCTTIDVLCQCVSLKLESSEVTFRWNLMFTYPLQWFRVIGF